MIRVEFTPKKGIVDCAYKEVVCSYIQIATFPPTAQLFYTQSTIPATHNPQSLHLLCQRTAARNVSFINSSRLGLGLLILTLTLIDTHQRVWYQILDLAETALSFLSFFLLSLLFC